MSYTPVSYSDAQDMMRKARNGYRKLANNTYLHQRGDSYAVRLHATDIVIIHPDGTFSLNTGGWFTVTTKDRINRFSPARVYSEAGVWCVWTDNDPRTAPKIQKCRTCHGTGEVTVTDYGYRMFAKTETCTQWFCEIDGETYPGSKFSIELDLKYPASRKTPPEPLRRGGQPVTGQPEQISIVGQVRTWRSYVPVGSHKATCGTCDGSRTHDYGSKPNPVRFADGITVNARGEVTDKRAPRLHQVTPADKRNAAAERKITRYIDGLTDAKITELWEHAITEGTAGDCWYCSLVTTDGRTMGQLGDDVSHIRDHVAERYYMATLIRNALAAKGYRDPLVIFHLAAANGSMADTLRQNVKVYLRKRLITGRPVRAGK
jgi:hypothetical protein